MKEPPHQYRRRDDEHAEDLVAAKRMSLDLPPFLLGDLLLMRLDAAFNHSFRALKLRISIGGSSPRNRTSRHTRCRGGLTSHPPIADDCLSA